MIYIYIYIVEGDKGLFSFAPPHQGIDGEWSDGSGVIVYKWNEKGNRPNTGRSSWKKRWSCCGEYDENAPPCRKGWHVSYDDGFTLFWFGIIINIIACSVLFSRVSKDLVLIIRCFFAGSNDSTFNVDLLTGSSAAL